MYRLAINDQNIRRCSTGGQLIDRRKLSAVTHSAASVSPPSSLIRGWLFSQENGLVAAATQREDRSESVSGSGSGRCHVATERVHCTVIGMADWAAEKEGYYDGQTKKRTGTWREFLGNSYEYWCNAKAIKVVALFDIFPLLTALFCSSKEPPPLPPPLHVNMCMIHLLIRSHCLRACAARNHPVAKRGAGESRGQDRKHHNHVGMN